jgi:hypothetical protein
MPTLNLVHYNCIVAPRPPVDLPRVEPYAVGRWTPNEAGLYAQADLFPSGKLYI